jgi:hypothetical protein
VGSQNISLSVTDLDDTHRRVRAAGYEPDQEPFEIAGVRMFFVKDPDGTAVEFIDSPASTDIGGTASWHSMTAGRTGTRIP